MLGRLSERVDQVVKTIIEPVLANDGGRLDILDIDEGLSELRMRFVGSCANCPYALLSMEQIVKPILLAIPGIQRVVLRAKARNSELVVLAQTANPLVELPDTAAPPLAP